MRKRTNIGLRIEAVAEDKLYTFTKMAKEMDVSYRTLQNILSSQSNVGSKFIIKFCTKFGVSYRWLLTGEGDMYSNHCNSPSLPDDLKEQLLQSAQNNAITLDAEILLRLKHSLKNYPISNKQFMSEIDLKQPENLEILRTVVKEVIAKEKEKRADN